MRRPCKECPFRKDGPKISRRHAKEIMTPFANGTGGMFPCHKTADVDEDDGTYEAKRDGSSRHCAGALIFAEKHNMPTQMMRIAERLGLYDPTKLEGTELVFDSMAEALENRPTLRRK